MNRTALACTSIASVGVLGAAALVNGGPLDPPAGPVASTLKTLAEVEPRIAINQANTPGDADSLFRITQPGSYYLTGNVLGVADKTGIEIAASDVSVDLMGFTLEGAPGSLHGVSTGPTPTSNVRVANGVVDGWGGLGIELIEAVSAQVVGVRSSGNGGIGILCGQHALVHLCIASGNGSDGISGASGAIVVDCAAVQNAGHGVSLDAGSVARGCVARSNGVAGITAVLSTLTACTSTSNTGDGIVVSGCTVTACTAAASTGDGIEASGACRLIDNTCRSNGAGAGDGAGIYLTGTDNVAEGNNCTFNDRGMHADASGNVIARNTCSGNTTNWDLVAGNVFGPIVDRTAPGSAAVLGNSAPDTMASTHPGANFSY